MGPHDGVNIVDENPPILAEALPEELLHSQGVFFTIAVRDEYGVVLFQLRAAFRFVRKRFEGALSADDLGDRAEGAFGGGVEKGFDSSAACGQLRSSAEKRKRRTVQ